MKDCKFCDKTGLLILPLRYAAVAGEAAALSAVPELPTIEEAANLKGFDASSWFGLLAPAGTPPDIVKRLSAEVDAALKLPAIAKRLTDLGAVPVGGAPAKLAAHQKAEQAKWAAVIQAAKIKAD